MSFLVPIVVAAAVGSVLARGSDLSGSDGFAYRLLAGLSVTAVFVVAVGSYSLRLTEFLVYVLAVGAVWAGLRGYIKRGTPQGPPAPSIPWTKLEAVALCAVVAANALALISALAPNTNWDAGVAHLALPSDYAREGRIFFSEGNAYSAYPHLLHALYGLAFFMGGERPVALLNWSFGPLACLAVYGLGKRLDSRRCGLIAAGLFACSPIFFDQVGTVSLDVPFTAMAMAAMACLAAWTEKRSMHWLLFAGLLAGSSCGIRHTGYLVCPLLLLAVMGSSGRRFFKPAAVFGICAMAGAAPWLIRSAVVADNPVYPFLQNQFPTPALPDIQTAVLGTHETITGMGWTDLFMFPWNIVMRPHWYDGWAKSPGGAVLFLGIPGLFVGGAAARWLGTYSAAGGLAFFFFQRFARYLLPFFAPMMVVAALAVCRLKRWQGPLAGLLVLTYGYGLFLGAGTVHFKVPAALGIQSEEDYLASRIERYWAFDWVNHHLPEEGTIMVFDPRSYFIKRPTFQNPAILRVLREKPIEEQMQWLREHGVKYLFYPRAYVEESPAYKAYGFAEDLDAWRRDSGHFQRIKVITLPRVRGGGLETVEIYRVRYDRRNGSGDSTHVRS